jgi:cytosine/adenosine deaminase-related metal-dependent hydrolase
MRILAARWVLPISSPPIEYGAVAIDDALIAAVGSLADLESRYPDAPTQDLGEAAILPGLVNVHTHLELSVFRGRLETPVFIDWILELVRLKREALTPEDIRLSALLGCVEAIRAGITTVADTASRDAVLAALIESGQRGVIFQECFGPATEQASSSIAELEADLDLNQSRLSDSTARERLTLGVSPHAPYTVSAELYRRVANLARERNLDLGLHAAESVDEGLLLRNGTGAFAESLRKRGIAWEPPGCSMVAYLARLGILERSPLLIHCVDIDEADIALMAANRARMAHCPKSNAKLRHGIAPLMSALEAGVRVGLGSDSVASNNNCDIIEEARFASLLQVSKSRVESTQLDGERMLRLMTIDGARALNLDDKIGTIETGKQADLIAIDLSSAQNTPHYDPATAIVFSCSGRDCILTMVGGQVLYESGEVKSIDEEWVLMQAAAISHRALKAQ